MEEENPLIMLAAFVVLKPGVAQPDAATTRQLQDFVKSRLAPYKYPRRVQYLNGLPKTGTDKIDKTKLKLSAKAG